MSHIPPITKLSHTIHYRSGLGTKLKYIDEEDLASQKVQLRSAEERAMDSEYNINPDADDMRVLRRNPSIGSILNIDQRIKSRTVSYIPYSMYYYYAR